MALIATSKSTAPHVYFTNPYRKYIVLLCAPLFVAHLLFFLVKWVHFHWAINLFAPRVPWAWLVLPVMAL